MNSGSKTTREHSNREIIKRSRQIGKSLQMMNAIEEEYTVAFLDEQDKLIPVSEVMQIIDEVFTTESSNMPLNYHVRLKKEFELRKNETN